MQADTRALATWAIAGAVAVAGLAGSSEEGKPGSPAVAAAAAEPQDAEARLARARQRMVAVDLAGRGVADAAVLEAMGRVPRHLYVPEALRDSAYADHPWPIGQGQTISQPYIVAYMTALLDLEPEDRVLEIGTGSGYQAAILAEIAAEVYTIEIIPELAQSARARLSELGYDNIHVRAGDGYAGWPAAAPFDAIVVTAAPGRVPEPLVEQLAEGAHLVIPVGTYWQELLRLTREGGEVRTEKLIGVRFVPMTGEVQRRR